MRIPFASHGLRYPCRFCGEPASRKDGTCYRHASGARRQRSHMPILRVVTCYHCVGLSVRSCHLCGATRRIDGLTLESGLTLWAKPGCTCDACWQLGQSRKD